MPGYPRVCRPTTSEPPHGIRVRTISLFFLMPTLPDRFHRANYSCMVPTLDERGEPDEAEACLWCGQAEQTERQVQR